MSKEDFETIKTKDGMVDIKYYHDLAQLVPGRKNNLHTNQDLTQKIPVCP